MEYWAGDDELQLGLAVGGPDPQSPQSTSQDQQYLPFRLNIVNNVVPDLDFAIETGNIRFSPDIHEWVCYRRNHFSISLSVLGNVPLDTTVLLEAAGAAGSVPLCQSGASRKSDTLTPVEPQVLVNGSATFTRLHFKMATKHNNLVNGRVNPEQEYFQLFVSLVSEGQIILSKVSDRLVVRGGNPGRYKEGVLTVCFEGRVGINEAHPKHELVVNGDVQYTGNLLKQSDERVKENFKAVDPSEQLERIKNVKVYDYQYKEEFDPKQRKERGVKAQELREVIPEAVVETQAKGQELLVVDRDRLQIEVLGATKAVAEQMDELEERVEEIESQPRTLVTIINQYKTDVKTGCLLSSPGWHVFCCSMVLLTLTGLIFALSQKTSDYYPEPTEPTTFLMPFSQFYVYCTHNDTNRNGNSLGGNNGNPNGNNQFDKCLGLYNEYVENYRLVDPENSYVPSYFESHLMSFLAAFFAIGLAVAVISWLLFAFCLALKHRHARRAENLQMAYVVDL